MTMKCDTCHFYNYDEDYGDYVCDAGMDEDEYARVFASPRGRCPFYQKGDDYYLPRHQ